MLKTLGGKIIGTFYEKDLLRWDFRNEKVIN